MECVMSERDFQATVLEHLVALQRETAEQTGEMKNIVSRLDRLNGSVAKHEAQIGALMAERAERRAVSTYQEKWKEHLKPVIVYLVIGLGILLATHAKEIVTVWRSIVP
jgi:hypothetical protein